MWPLMQGILYPKERSSEMSKNKKVVKIHNGVEMVMDGRPVIVGILTSPENLEVDSYQREPLGSQVDKCLKAFEEGVALPTIDLGLRGDKVERIPYQGYSEFIIDVDKNAPFIIDGQQRMLAFRRAIEEGLPNCKIQVTLHLNTDYDFERKRFIQLNFSRTQASGNLYLKNIRQDVPAIQALWAASEYTKFPLYHSVCWVQQKRDDHVITACYFAYTMVRLMGELVNAKPISTAKKMTIILDEVYRSIGKSAFKKNIYTFFEFMNDVWSISDTSHPAGYTPVAQNFPWVLAWVLSKYSHFWNDQNELVLPKKMVSHMKKFKLSKVIHEYAMGDHTKAQYLFDKVIDHVDKAFKGDKRYRR